MLVVDIPLVPNGLKGSGYMIRESVAAVGVLWWSVGFCIYLSLRPWFNLLQNVYYVLERVVSIWLKNEHCVEFNRLMANMYLAQTC